MPKNLKISISAILAVILILMSYWYVLKPQAEQANKVTKFAFYNIEGKGFSSLNSAKDKLILKKDDDVQKVVKIIKGANRNPGIPDMASPEILLSLINNDGTSDDYYIWCSSSGYNGSLMSTKDSNVLYTITQEDTSYIRELLMSAKYFKKDYKTYEEVMVQDNKISGNYDTGSIVDVSKDARYFIMGQYKENTQENLFVLWDNLKKVEVAKSWVGIHEDCRKIIPDNLKSEFYEFNKELSNSIARSYSFPMTTTIETQNGVPYQTASHDEEWLMYDYGSTPLGLRVYNTKLKKHIVIIDSSRMFADKGKMREERWKSWWLADGSIFAITRVNYYDEPKIQICNAKIYHLKSDEISKSLDNGEIYNNLIGYYGSQKAPQGQETIVNMATTNIHSVMPFDDGFLVLVTHNYNKPELDLFYMKIGKGIIKKFSGQYPKANSVSINKANINDKNIIFGRASDTILNSNNQSMEADYSRIEVEVTGGDSYVRNLSPEAGYRKNGFVLIEDKDHKTKKIKFYDWQSDLIKEENIPE